MNPEFRRLLLSEFQGYRLIALPMVLAGTFIVAYLANGRELDTGTAFVAVLAYFALVFIWGTRQAAESVVQEINAKTWDPQRMSSMSAWGMAWAKLFGSTSLTWVGGAVCLVFYAVSNVETWGRAATLNAVVLYAGAGLLAQAVCLLVSLTAIQRRREFGRVRMLSYQFLGLLAALPPLYIGMSVTGGEGVMDLMRWYGQYVTLARFMMVAMLAFGFWALAGNWALMRAELQEPLGPWLWLGFVVFAMALVGGVRTLPMGANAALVLIDVPSTPEMVLGCGLALVYLALMLEPKGRVRLRRLAGRLAARDIAAALKLAPRSLLAVPVVAIGVTAAAVGTRDYTAAQAVALHPMLAAWLLFALRDIGFVYWLCLGRRDGRGDGVAAVVLLLAYGAVPATLNPESLAPLSALFAPVMPTSSGTALRIWSIAAPALELLCVGWLLSRRWRRAAQPPNGS